MAHQPATIVETGDGRVYRFWVDGGTLKGSLHAAKDRSLIAGPWSTNLTGISSEATVDADETRGSGNRICVLLLVSSGGSTLVYTSSDGRHFS